MENKLKEFNIEQLKKDYNNFKGSEGTIFCCKYKN